MDESPSAPDSAPGCTTLLTESAVGELCRLVSENPHNSKWSATGTASHPEAEAGTEAGAEAGW